VIAPEFVQVTSLPSSVSTSVYVVPVCALIPAYRRPAVTAACTNAVVASRVLSFPALCVGAVGFPVNAGDANGAYDCALTNAVVAIDVSLSPVDGVGAVGFPVNAGESNGALPDSKAAARVCRSFTAT